MFRACEISYIYVLKDLSNNVRYVGQSVEPGNRFTAHTKDPYDNYKSRWLKKLGCAPIQEVIESAPKKLITERENYWIDYYSRLGCRITNSAPGNDTRTTQQLRQDKLNKFGRIGVRKQKKNWLAFYRLNGKPEYLGSFKSKIVAQKHYDNVARYYEKFPVTNFSGTVAYPIEKAKVIGNKVNRKASTGSYYDGIYFDKEAKRFKVRIFLPLEKTFIYVSSFKEESEALYYRDRVALHLGVTTYKHHNEEPLTVEEVQQITKESRPITRGKSKFRGATWNSNNQFFVCSVIIDKEEVFIAGGFQEDKDAAIWHDRIAKHYGLVVNEEPDFACTVEEAKQLIRKERTELGTIGVAQVGKRFTARFRFDGEDHYIGIFPKIEDATYYSDAVRNYYGLTNNNTTTDKLSLEEAKAKIASLVTTKGIRQKGKTWTVRINIDKQEYTISRIKTKEQAIYISDALRNYYNLPNSQTTQDKLSLEEAKELVKATK